MFHGVVVSLVSRDTLYSHYYRNEKPRVSEYPQELTITRCLPDGIELQGKVSITVPSTCFSLWR